MENVRIWQLQTICASMPSWARVWHTANLRLPGTRHCTTLEKKGPDTQRSLLSSHQGDRPRASVCRLLCHVCERQDRRDTSSSLLEGATGTGLRASLAMDQNTAREPTHFAPTVRRKHAVRDLGALGSAYSSRTSWTKGERQLAVAASSHSSNVPAEIRSMHIDAVERYLH